MAKLAKWVLPDVVDPDDTVCFTINVPKNIYHIAAFRGAMLALASAYKWQDDLAHTAKHVAQVWQRVIDTMGNCGELCDECIAEGERLALNYIDSDEDDCMKFRIDPDNPCVIQALCEPTGEYLPWYDPSACISGIVGIEAGQPAPFGPVPAGECKSWNVVLRGNEKWLLPTGVKAGDIITITNAKGGVLMDGLFNWRCPSGDEYILDACVPYDFPCSACPLPSVNEGRLIMSVGTDYYDAYNTSTTVPSGVTSPVACAFQVNDSDLTDNSGSYSFTVELCSAEPIIVSVGITYDSGSGPSTANIGDEITITPDEFGSFGGYSQFAMHFDRCVNVKWISGDIALRSGGPVDFYWRAVSGSPSCGGAADTYYITSSDPSTINSHQGETHTANYMSSTGQSGRGPIVLKLVSVGP